MSYITCPECSYSRSWKLRRGKRKCKNCRREYALNDYPVVGFRLTSVQWQQCVSVFLRERTYIRVAQELSVSFKTAQRVTHYIRLCMSELKPGAFTGPLEMDETYIGGQRKNKKLHIRRRPSKRGHGTDKLPIVGLFDRHTGQVYVEVLPRKLDIGRILEILTERSITGATVYTDGFKMYRMLPKYNFRHEWVDHDGGELVRGDIHTNNIEGFWGILKRKLSCIGGMRRDRLHLFVAEIAWRFNHRDLTLKEQEDALIHLIYDN